MHVDHFTYGAITPGLAYALSVLGSLLGLVCTVRARAMPDRGRRARWLLLAAWAIGGTGIWVMHFMAMIGFSVANLPVRFDVTITIASWITAIVAVGIGLFIVGFGDPNPLKIIAGGVFAGVGVASMHYSGMAAMRIPGTITYDRTLVIASIAIAIVAATVALWFTVTLRKGGVITVAALIMGIAVSGMHYTGMFAMSVTDLNAQPVTGLLPLSFLAPIVVFVVAVVIVLMVALINRSGTDGEETAGGRPDSTGGNPGDWINPAPTKPSGFGGRRTSPSAFVSRPSRP